jgi:DNA-directed RNA polymerase specialized sigma24 family protein
MTNTEFEQLIEKNKNRMYRFAFSILKNHEDAKGIVQEAVLELWKKKMRLDTSKNMDSFCMNTINCKGKLNSSV